MSANFFLKSIAFSNYRGLHGLDVKAFRRINLIGGFNGVGKSTLLEAIFFLLDRRGPISLTRPFMWRQIGMAGKGTLDQYFKDLDSQKSIAITAGTSSGQLVISMEFGPTPVGVTVQVTPFGAGMPRELQQSVGNDLGLNVQARVDDNLDDALFALPMPDGLAVNPYRRGTSKLPPGVLLSAQARSVSAENAEKFSTAIKERRLPELLKILSVISPTITGVQLLQLGGAPLLHAQFEDGSLLPFPMLGDGIQTLLSISLSIMTSPGGVILLDEFDSAIHYSVLAEIWSKIAVLANKYNCQIFAVTHSLECIKSALAGITNGSRREDFLYVRLERHGSQLASISFDGQELKDSLNADWEIR